MAKDYEVSKVNFTFLVLNSILAAGLLGGSVTKWGSQLAEGLPQLVWVGMGFLAVALPLYPVVTIWKRARTGEDLSFKRYLVGAFAGALVAPAIYYVL